MANCSQELRIRSKPYPKTCAICGLGPCSNETVGPIVMLERATEKLRSRVINGQVLQVNPVLREVIKELDRQYAPEEIGGEEYSLHSDDINNQNREMAFGALSYLYHYIIHPDRTDLSRQGAPAPITWKWDPRGWKPKGPRRDLIRAIALLIREVEQLDRKELK